MSSQLFSSQPLTCSHPSLRTRWPGTLSTASTGSAFQARARLAPSPGTSDRDVAAGEARLAARWLRLNDLSYVLRYVSISDMGYIR